MSQLRISDWSSTVVQNDNLLPTQVEPRENRMGGCRHLVLRFFEQAREDFCRYAPSRRKGKQGKQTYEEVKTWLDSDETFFYSFCWVCDYFGWDAGWTRKALYEEAARGEPRTAIRQMNAGIGSNKITG